MAARLSIAQFNDGYPPVTDGVVTCVRNYAYWLNSKYADCALFVPDRRHARYEEPYPVVGYRSLPLLRRPPYRVGVPALDWQYRRRLSRMRFDLVHTHSPFSAGAEALRLKRERGIPAVATFHSKYYEDFYAYTGSRLIAEQGVRLLVQRLLRMDRVFAVSDGAANTLRGYGFKGPVDVIENGVDLAMPDDPAPLLARADALIGAPRGVPVLLYVGQLVWQKNLRLILNASRQLSQSGANFLMLMVGDGPARRELATLVDQGGLNDRFRFTGVITDRALLGALYLRARALVFPSLYDTSALVVKEAAALGCPAVVVAQSSIAQGIADGRNGLLCEDDALSLARAMRHAIQAPERMAAIGERARATLVRRWESVVDEVYAAYEQILCERRCAKAV